MLGPDALLYYRAALVLAVVPAAVTFWMLRRAGVAPSRAIALQLALLLAAHIGGRIQLVADTSAPESGIWLGVGYRHAGAILGVVLALPVFRRLLTPTISLPAAADAFMPSIGLGLAAVRLGCLAIGCCFGLPSSLPWALRFPRGSLAFETHVASGWLSSQATQSLPVHPLQVYFALLALLATGVGVWVYAHRRFAGQGFLVFLGIHESGKFALEWLRQPYSGGSDTLRIWGSFALAVLVAVLLAATQRRIVHE